MKPSNLRRNLLAAALAAVAAASAAQDFSLRPSEPRSAALPSVWSGAAAPLSPAAALAPALAAASAPLPLAAPALSAAPSAAPAEPPARSARARASAPAAAEGARADAARTFDGSAAGRASDYAELEAVRRLAAPFRTKAQLARLEAKPRPAGESYRFAVIGDAEPGRFWWERTFFKRTPGVFWKMLGRADRERADFIVQLGDMVSRGVLRNFRAFFRRLRAAAPRTPYLTVIGNHDRHKPHGRTNSIVYRSLFGKTNYAFERGGRRFVVLDNSAGRVTSGQLKWLRTVLSADKPAIVFTHIPPAPLHEWTDFIRRGSGGFRVGADEFMSLMSERKVARVYMGHLHGFGVLERGGVRYVLTGGGGSPLFPAAVKDRFHHYLTVDDGPDGLVETVHRSNGTSFVLP